MSRNKNTTEKGRFLRGPCPVCLHIFLRPKARQHESQLLTKYVHENLHGQRYHPFFKPRCNGVSLELTFVPTCHIYPSNTPCQSFKKIKICFIKRLLAYTKTGKTECSPCLLSYPDSNQDKQNQNLLCYHYTIRQLPYSPHKGLQIYSIPTTRQ